MKPDGTYTVDEILQICNDQLQSWERQELAKKLAKDSVYSAIRNMDKYELVELREQISYLLRRIRYNNKNS